MVCNDCGYTCSCILWHSNLCFDAHTVFHEQIKREREDYDHMGMRANKSGSVFGIPDATFCPICEERIGVTNHTCKKKDLSIDWLDFMKKWFGNGDKK